MKILLFILLFFTLLLTAYIADLLLTAGNMLFNILQASVGETEKIITPPHPVIIMLISTTASITGVMLIIHIAKAIRKEL